MKNIKQRRHAELTKASSTHVVLKDKQQLQAWKIPNQVWNDTYFYNGTGFTLIELLVVVLIIGILAAVALPQYQKAVAKARLANLVTMGNAVVQAEEIYYLANNAYTEHWEDLNISFQGRISDDRAGGAGDRWRNKTINMYLILQTSYQPDSVLIRDSLLPDVQLRFAFQSTTYGVWKGGRRACYALSTNKSANQLCQNVTGKKTTTSTSQNGEGFDYVYWFD